MSGIKSNMGTQELLIDLKKVIHDSLEKYAVSNNLEITSFYIPELNIKQIDKSATISLGFNSIVKSKGL